MLFLKKITLETAKIIVQKIWLYFGEWLLILSRKKRVPKQALEEKG